MLLVVILVVVVVMVSPWFGIGLLICITYTPGPIFNCRYLRKFNAGGAKKVGVRNSKAESFPNTCRSVLAPLGCRAIELIELGKPLQGGVVYPVVCGRRGCRCSIGGVVVVVNGAGGCDCAASCASASAINSSRGCTGRAGARGSGSDSGKLKWWWLSWWSRCWKTGERDLRRPFFYMKALRAAPR